MRSVRFLAVVVALALFPAGPAARADRGEANDGHGHGGHGSAPVAADGLAGAWAALEAARDAIAADVEAGKLETIHEKSEPIPGLAKALLTFSSDLDDAKRARVEGAVRQLRKVAGALHEAADAGDANRTRRALKQLDSLLALIRAQLPQEALSQATAADRDAHAHVRARAQVDETPRATIRVVADDYQFEPRALELRAGVPTRIELHNEGQIEHVLVVRTLDGSADAVHLHAAPKTADAGTFRFEEPGRYPLACTIPGHTEVGMVGELVVTTN